jgi:hypothetical protein
MITINHKYKIKAVDKRNVVPMEYREITPIKKVDRIDEAKYGWVDMGFYPTVQSAALGIISNEQKNILLDNEEGITVRDFIGELDKLTMQIREATKNIKVIEVEKEDKKKDE